MVTFFTFELMVLFLLNLFIAMFGHLQSIPGYCYYLVFLDDFSHYYMTFPLTNKFKVHSHGANFCVFVQTQFGLPIMSFQADNVTEFVNQTLASLFNSRGNGKARRVLRALNNITYTMLIYAHMPAPYWAKALATAIFLLNRRPCSVIGNSIPMCSSTLRYPTEGK